MSLESPALAGGLFTTVLPEKPNHGILLCFEFDASDLRTKINTNNRQQRYLYQDLGRMDKDPFATKAKRKRIDDEIRRLRNESQAFADRIYAIEEAKGKVRKTIHQGAVVNDTSPFKHEFPKPSEKTYMHNHDKVHALAKERHKETKEAYDRVMTWISERPVFDNRHFTVKTWGTRQNRSFHRPPHSRRPYGEPLTAADKGTDYIAMNKKLTNYSKTATHEFMHWYEERSKVFHKRSVNFLVDRAEGETPRRLNDIYSTSRYENHEIAIVDKWDSRGGSSYSGKVYGTWKGKDTLPGDIDATEILSMGVDKFFADPVKFARDDPEYFEFIVNTLHGVDDKWG